MKIAREQLHKMIDEALDERGFFKDHNAIDIQFGEIGFTFIFRKGEHKTTVHERNTTITDNVELV